MSEGNKPSKVLVRKAKNGRAKLGRNDCRLVFYCFYVHSWPLAASIEEVWIHGEKSTKRKKKIKMTNLVEDEEISEVCNI